MNATVKQALGFCLLIGLLPVTVVVMDALSLLSVSPARAMVAGASALAIGGIVGWVSVYLEAREVTEA